jgi:hypothetical protein
MILFVQTYYPGIVAISTKNLVLVPNDNIYFVPHHTLGRGEVVGTNPGGWGGMVAYIVSFFTVPFCLTGSKAQKFTAALFYLEPTVQVDAQFILQHSQAAYTTIQFKLLLSDVSSAVISSMKRFANIPIMTSQ